MFNVLESEIQIQINTLIEKEAKVLKVKLQKPRKRLVNKYDEYICLNGL